MLTDRRTDGDGSPDPILYHWYGEHSPGAREADDWTRYLGPFKGGLRALVDGIDSKSRLVDGDDWPADLQGD